MKLSLLLPSFLFTTVVLLAACSSDDAAKNNATPDGPDSGKVGGDQDGGTDPDGGGGKVETDIVFADGTTFQKRDCSIVVRWDGGGTDVKIAGEFTNWEKGWLPLTKANGGSAFEIKLTVGENNLEGGTLYAYKIVSDNNWKLDPNNRYRKIVDGQMNSGLMLPACASAPETLSGKVETKSVGGEMKAHVTVRGASDGELPDRVKASIDNKGVPQGAYTIDKATGSIDFNFKGLERGKHTLSLRSFDKKEREAEPVDLPFWIEEEAFDYRDGILYMMLIDRFANGDHTNDKPVGNPVEYDADWHGGDLQGALKVLESGYFEKMGVRTIWLSPLNAQTDNWHVGDGNQIFSAYHGYWPIKSREVEPRFGGDAALKAFVAEAHKRGLRVLLDLINNQVHEQHEYVTKNPDWFRKSCQCGDDAHGCGWSVRPFDCMFQPYLPDIDWTKSGAEKQFISDAVNWISAFDLDGFRVDAVKHVEANSVYNMRAELTRRFEQGGARIFMVGETAVGENDNGTFFGENFPNGYAWIDAYTGVTALDGQFDFPTRHNMADGLVSGDKPLNEVEDQLHKAETNYRPGNHHVRFLNGHDNPRIASIAAKDAKLGCSWSSGCRGDQLPPLSYSDPQVYVKLKRALTVLYSMPGVPYLYMGDELAFAGGGDPDMRRNMIFNEGLETLQMYKTGGAPAPITQPQGDLRDWVRKLGALRSSSTALRRGDRKTLLAEGDLWVYAYQTTGAPPAIVVINRGGAVTSRNVNAGGLAVTGVTWKSPLGTGSAATAGGDVSITIGAGEAAVFVAQ